MEPPALSFLRIVLGAFRDFRLAEVGMRWNSVGAIPETGLGVAVKCDDGATRAAETHGRRRARRILPITAAERDLFGKRLARPVESCIGVKVGETRLVAGLVEALRTTCNPCGRTGDRRR
jgi:hypothetical protein